MIATMEVAGVCIAWRSDWNDVPDADRMVRSAVRRCEALRRGRMCSPQRLRLRQRLSFWILTWISSRGGEVNPMSSLVAHTSHCLPPIPSRQHPASRLVELWIQSQAHLLEPPSSLPMGGAVSYELPKAGSRLTLSHHIPWQQVR